jgi:hypothetical protein
MPYWLSVYVKILKWAKLKMSYILCDVGDVSEYGGGNSAVRLVAF